MSFRMKYKGGRWKLETTTIYEKENQNDEYEKQLLAEQKKLMTSFVINHAEKWSLGDKIKEAKRKDLEMSLKSNSKILDENVRSLFLKEYEEDALKLLKEDYQKYLDEISLENLKNTDTKRSFLMYSKMYVISDDVLEKLLPMSKKNSK